MHKKYTDGAIGNEKEIVIFYGFNSQKQRKTGKNTKKQEKNNAESKKKTENFAKSPFFYDLKNFVTFSIFIVTLSIHKSVFLCYNKFAKQKICGFFAPHAHARKFFRAGGGDDNAKRRFSVQQVAFQVGFNDPFYFSKAFKKRTGTTPKKYAGNPKDGRGGGELYAHQPEEEPDEQ